jgi:hypothetical protein
MVCEVLSLRTHTALHFTCVLTPDPDIAIAAEVLPAGSARPTRDKGHRAPPSVQAVAPQASSQSAREGSMPPIQLLYSVPLARPGKPHEKRAGRSKDLLGCSK